MVPLGEYAVAAPVAAERLNRVDFCRILHYF
jgi:hypothetical protein